MEKVDIIKIFLTIFCFAFLCSGIAMIGVGAYLISMRDYFTHVYGGNVIFVPSMLIIIGCGIIGFSLVGFVGIFSESYIALMMFSSSLVVIVLLEVIGGVVAAVLKERFHPLPEEFARNAKNTMGQYKGRPEIKEMWDYIQQNFHCCGTYNSSEWQDNGLFEGNIKPDSCCQGGKGQCSFGEYKIGCIESVNNFLSVFLLAVVITVFVFGAFEVIAVILSCIMAKEVNKFSPEEEMENKSVVKPKQAKKKVPKSRKSSKQPRKGAATVRDSLAQPSADDTSVGGTSSSVAPKGKTSSLVDGSSFHLEKKKKSGKRSPKSERDVSVAASTKTAEKTKSDKRKKSKGRKK